MYEFQNYVVVRVGFPDPYMIAAVFAILFLIFVTVLWWRE